MTASEAPSFTPGIATENAARRECGLPWFVVLLIVGLPFVLRFQFVSVPVPFNLDEAQWTVTARSAFNDPILWRSIDMQTSGPLNAVAIAWPKMFGVTPSIFTTRLTAFALESLMLLGMTTFIRRGEALSLGMAAILTAAIWMTVTPLYDFLCYSSELVPLTLIVWFCVVFAGFRLGARAGPRFALCGLIAAALPFAKMQSAPFAVVLQAACLFRLWMNIRARQAGAAEVAWWFAGSAVPFLVLVAPLFLVGEQDAFLKGYLGLAYGYGGRRIFEFLIYTGFFIPCMAIIWAILCARYRDPASRRQARADLFLISLGLWPAVFLAVWLPGRHFLHYHWFSLIGLPLSVLIAQYSLPVVQSRLPTIIRVLGIVVIVCLGVKGPVFAARAQWLGLYQEGAMDRAFESPGLNPRPLFAWTGAGSNETLFLWGWEPELTAFSGMRSASRAAIAEYLVRPNNARDYFRARLLRELSKTNPAIVLDTMRDGYFFNNDPDLKLDQSDLRSFPALDRLVEANYELVAGGGRCASVYLRKDRAASLRAAEVPLKSSIETLVDGPTDELCDDWWAPLSPSAVAELTVNPPSPIKELWILPSRGGSVRGLEPIARDRGTTKVDIRFVSASGAQSEQTAPLVGYPNWTVISAPEIGPVARIEIQSLEHVGEGPALAGVRAFNRRW
jgi:hypothetical protein